MSTTTALQHPGFSPAIELSARETEVIEHIAEGLTNGEIAERMHISTRTVRSHVEHALLKTNSRSRLELAVAAWRTAQRGNGNASRLVHLPRGI
jgi:DNA-binding NarL/FixJ family response regulator